MFTKNEYVQPDISKFIHYLSLSAEQKNSDVQFFLGKIYYLNKYISRDINKSIHYLLLAANQNHQNVQLLLGIIYYEGKYVKQINSLFYFISKPK